MDACLFILRTETNVAFLAVYIDDIWLLTSDVEFRDYIVLTLQLEYYMRIIGKPIKFLGMNLTGFKF